MRDAKADLAICEVATKGPWRKVRSFVLPGLDNLGQAPERINAGEHFDRLELHHEYLGDYGIDWILCYKNNTLAAQYNARFVESIEFDVEGADKDDDH